MHTSGIAVFVLYYMRTCEFLCASAVNSRAGIRSELIPLFLWNSSWYLVGLLGCVIMRKVSTTTHSLLWQCEAFCCLCALVPLHKAPFLLPSLYTQNPYSPCNAQLEVPSSGKPVLNVKERGNHFLFCALSVLTLLNCECWNCPLPTLDWGLLKLLVYSTLYPKPWHDAYNKTTTTTTMDETSK